MMSKKPTTEIVRIPIVKKNGKYPVKLRVTYDRFQKYYPCNVDLSEDEFTRIISTNTPKKPEKSIRNALLCVQTKALAVIDGMKTFNFETFEFKLHERKSVEGEVYDMFKKINAELIANDRVGNGIMYHTVMNSVKAFTPKLTFQDITPQFLYAYEKWMLTETETKKGKSMTTVGIYMRHLRSVYNRAVSENLASKEEYPFLRNKYVIPVGNNHKKALTIKEIAKIFQYPTPADGWERRAKDFWCFSYLCNGINIADIAQLRYRDIDNDEIRFVRAKTMRTNRGKTNTTISVHLLPQARKIISTWGNSEKAPENYVFHILSPGMTAIEIKKSVQQFTKNMNKYTKRIASELGIDKNVTTYVARHSYATVLKRSGAAIELISENLGHSNVATTKNYLDSFESEERKKVAGALVAFDTHPG